MLFFIIRNEYKKSLISVELGISKIGTMIMVQFPKFRISNSGNN